jgi:uncharacterized protein YqhQ
VACLTARPIIGGQAVVEGVMMRSPKSLAIAVRQPDGTIALREEAWLSFAERLPFLKWPIFRGANMLIESMYNGMLALNWSAATAFPDDSKAVEASAKGQRGLNIALFVSLGFAFLLFKGVPHMSAWGLGQYFGFDGTSPLFHLVDGAIKACVFAGYITLISMMKDVKRLFMYHGAEHKSVHVWEAGEDLDVEHARTKSTAHPRCGTSLILLVIAVSILVFAAVLPFVPKVFDNELEQTMLLLVLKIPLLLPIAGVAYEAQRLAAKHPKNPLVRAIIAPGMLMQRLTTRQPGDGELEVALAALRKTVWREKSADVVPIHGKSTVEVFPDFATVAQKVA